ncbi:MAG: CaiB/BaiF CoA transferase family protein, partial [Candidatus Dormibacteraceae bacterium]
MDGALAGFRVVDLSQDVAGPYCTKLLAGLGARVIKVEPPGSGDPSRRSGPAGAGEQNLETSPSFLYLNTGKESVTLDLDLPDGRAVLERLLVDADVLVESFPPGRLATLGLGDEPLHRLNPRLVITSITNFGQTGPYRDYKADEINLLALGGLLFITGEPDQPPLRMGGRLCQYTAGQNALIGTLAALLARRQTGRGQQVDVSIMETVMAILEGAITHWSYHQELRGRAGTAATAGWGIYPCKDGFVAAVSGG